MQETIGFHAPIHYTQMQQSTMHQVYNAPSLQCTKSTMHKYTMHGPVSGMKFDYFWEDDEISLRDSYQLAQALSGEVADITTSITSHCPVLL